MSNRLKDWKLKINGFMDTPYGILIGILSVILLAFFTLTIIGAVTTTPDEEAKQMIQKVSFEGHDYLIYKHRVMCHSPNCRCHDKGSK